MSCTYNDPYTYNDLRREAFHEEIMSADFDYDFSETDCEEKIEIEYIYALSNCYSIFRILKEYDDIISRFYFKNDNFYILLKK
nr:MAG: hypothetical protein [Microvirus Sku119]